MTVADLLAACSLPRGDGLRLLSYATGLRRETLLAAGETTLTPAVERAFTVLSRRRKAGMPIAYLLGAKEFYGRSFQVDPRVLIPRPETELLVDRAIDLVRRSRDGRSTRPAILDLGTGSGAIAVTLALECSDVDVVATDLSADALVVARANGHRLKASLTWLEGDWFDIGSGGLQGRRFDLIASNPPYIAVDDHHLREGDLRYEPPKALASGSDGLESIRRIVHDAPLHLAPAGSLILEHGHDQAETVRALLAAAGFIGIASFRDLAGIERVTLGTTAA